MARNAHAGKRLNTARHFRVFPGQSVHSAALAELVLCLNRLGYRREYSFEVFNDDYQQMPLPTIAARTHARTHTHTRNA